MQVIAINELTKKFNNQKALVNVNAMITKHSIFGLLGSNGSGKSTLLRSIAGIFPADTGQIQWNGQDVFENMEFKSKLFFVPDEPFFFPHSHLDQMAGFYRKFHQNWDDEEYKKLLDTFQINPRMTLTSFSKGMKRQAMLILSLSASPEYLLLDEAFDGLDTVMCNVLKQILIQKVSDKRMTVIISSHNLRDVENLCDSICILHQGKTAAVEQTSVFLDSLVSIQIAFKSKPDKSVFSPFQILHYEEIGHLVFVTMQGNAEEILLQLQAMEPVFLEQIPVRLEEAFSYKMEELGYEAKYKIEE